MPTAAEFRATADALDALAQASGLAEGTIGSIGIDTGVRGGSFAPTIERGLDTTALNLGVLGGRCSEAAAEARRRAVVCDVYTADLNAYRGRLDTWTDQDPTGTLPRPTAPTPPASWVEAG